MVRGDRDFRSRCLAIGIPFSQCVHDRQQLFVVDFVVALRILEFP